MADRVQLVEVARQVVLSQVDVERGDRGDDQVEVHVEGLHEVEDGRETPGAKQLCRPCCSLVCLLLLLNVVELLPLLFLDPGVVEPRCVLPAVSRSSAAPLRQRSLHFSLRRMSLISALSSH